MTPLPAFATIARAAAALAAGETSSTALVEASLAVIAERGQQTNAFTLVHADAARAAADRADRERSSGRRLGPLHGIPVSIKDLIDEAGVVTTAASRVFANRRATRDALVVERLRHAGAIVIGRTNLHELALGTTSEDSAFGPVRHPVVPTRSAGGSSGGAAVAVALGMGLGAVGTDTGGSIRIPAAACGVVGLKPSAGDVPTDGVLPLSRSLDHVGPLTRTVSDAATLYAVLAGTAPTTLRAVRLTEVRVAWLEGYFEVGSDRDVRHAIAAAAQRLTSAGVRLDRAALGETQAIASCYVDIVLPEAAHEHASDLDTRADAYTPPVRERLLQGRLISAVDYLSAQQMRVTLRASVDALLADVDALMLPTLPIVAPPIGAQTVTLDARSGPVPLRGVMLKHTQLFNLTGHPAISLPVAATGLPVGLQLVGRRGETWRLLEIAAALEEIVRCP